MLSVVEGRVLGCLLEKERSTPDQYPLSLNALVLACNQSTSREPLMHLAEEQVAKVLAELKSQGLLRYVHPSHGRSVIRYRQVADERWGLEAAGAAVIAVLLLRGPQTVAELRARCERLHSFESPEAIGVALDGLSSSGVVQLLQRQPGQKEARWQQLLADEETVALGDVTIDNGTTVGSVGVESMTQRLERLELRVARLESALADLLPES